MCSETPAIFSTRSLRAAGRSPAQIASAVRSGTLRRLRRGVFATAAVCPPAVTAARHGGRLACVSAAREMGLWVLDEGAEVHVWLTAGGHLHPHDDHPGGACDCVHHWDCDVEGAHHERASPRRVLRQILLCFGVEHFFVALESALRHRMLTASDLAWLHRHTSTSAREAIAFARSDADSGLESLVRWRLRIHGLHVRTQRSVYGVGLVDLLVGDRLLVEVDGRANHDGQSLRHKDLVRDATAAVWGYVTLRFDYAMVVHDWPLVESAILAHVDRGLHLV